MSIVKRVQSRVNRLRAKQNLNARFSRSASPAEVYHQTHYEGKKYVGKFVGRKGSAHRKNLASLIRQSRHTSRMAGKNVKGGKNLTERYGGAKNFV